jgi:putative mycofactocin binding protein MftB
LSFLKSPTLLAVVQGLGTSMTAREACQKSGVTADELAVYERALATLADSQMIRERTNS